MKTGDFLTNELPKIYAELKKGLADKEKTRLQFSFSKLDLAELLNNVNCEKIFYFKSKYKDFSFLGLGHSETISAQNLKTFTEKHPELFLTTQFSFEGDPKDASFILPEWIFVTEGETTHLFVSKSLEYKNFSAPNLFFNTNFDLNHYDPFIPPWASYEEFPEHDQWTEMINACNALFAKGDLEKIVMSRKKIYGYSEPLEAISFFKSLLEKNPPTTYQIFNQTSFGKAFLSLTPERLFSIDHKQFESISLAGSAPRGKTPEEDAQFEQELKASDKLTREHNIVTNEIVKKLTPLSRELNVSPLETMKLPYIQHRAAPIRALLSEETDALTLVSLLHPTPAVGGLPWDKAKTKILELEPYKRDEYAAPIGIIGECYSELAVGIRSALIENEVLTIFGGAGIVAGSVPEDEWNETGTKMNPFLKVVHNE